MEGVYEVTYSLSMAWSLCVVQEKFSCNSIRWVSLPEILVMASLLRTAHGRVEGKPTMRAYSGEEVSRNLAKAP
jgi:hypothetical protein